MTVDLKFDFGGYATKNDLVCADGRTIRKDAFKHNDKQKVPLVWQHIHNDPLNILGHAYLENREDGVYVYCTFNDTPSGQQAKMLVEHKDIESLSIYANKLKEKNKVVHEGTIREVSLVLSGANPGALIDYINISHSDDGSIIDSEDEAIIFTGLPISKEEPKVEEPIKHADESKDEETVEEILGTLNDKQKNVVGAVIARAIESTDNEEIKQDDDKGETFMKKNVFDKEEEAGPVLTHDQLQEFAKKVFADTSRGGTFKEAFLAHAGTYGIDNISYLFPDAKLLDNEPGFDTRRMEWVQGWLSGTRHIPFSRIKKVWADLTPAAARAKGYITGNEKVEQVFALLKRTTEPTTIYKKQKLDRDDIVDITDFDVVAWMWREMRFMLDEEVARAALVGDGRVFGTDDDAIDPSKIRPIYGDAALFVHYLTLAVTVIDPLDIIDAILEARVNYKGSGTPNFYTTNEMLTSMLLVRDGENRRMYRSVQELAADLRVANIIEVEVLEGVQRDNASPVFTADLLGIMVNPRDYTYGADKGGQIATFSDFDIDFNQNKYLIETRLSGSLLNPKSALVVERKTA